MKPEAAIRAGFLCYCNVGAGRHPAHLRSCPVPKAEAALDALIEELEWIATCNPDTNDVNSIAHHALHPEEETSS
jgi:hypothetical protein